MSLKFPYIDISVTVTNSDGQPTSFSSANAPKIMTPSLQDIAARFVGLTDGFLIWTRDGRRGYTHFSIGADGMPLVGATLMCNRDVLLAGRQVLNLLAALKSRVLEGELLTEDTIDKMIESSGFAAEPLVSECDAWSDTPGQGFCCRMYATASELANILGFPRQKEYAPFEGVVIVNSVSQPVAGSGLTEISTPLDNSLMVVCPEGVESSVAKVGFSDHLTVTYTCKGFDPVAVMFEVGTTNRYVRINGPALVVNSAHHAGIIFRRRIPYTVTMLGGMPVDTYTILVNGRTANRSDEGFEVANTDFENGVVKVTVSSTNFSTFSQQYTPEELEAAAPIAVVLEPESREIVLRLDFGEGRIVEESINIEKNTSEYCQLRAGRFHGFRAHRLMGSSPETYNVDVKPTAEAVAAVTPTDGTLPFADGSATQGASDEAGPVAPVIEKAPSAIWEEKKPEIRAPKFENEAIGGGNPSSGRRFDFNKILIIGLFVVVGLFAIWYLVHLAGGGDKSSQLTTDTTSMTASGTVPAATATKAATASSDDEKADIAYLNNNKNTRWKKESLKTDKYKALIDLFANGDIDGIINHDYFAIKGQATNKTAIDIVDMLWMCKDTRVGREKYPKILRDWTKDGIVDIYNIKNARKGSIWNSLPPEADRNKSPRPQR